MWPVVICELQWWMFSQSCIIPPLFSFCLCIAPTFFWVLIGRRYGAVSPTVLLFSLGATTLYPHGDQWASAAIKLLWGVVCAGSFFFFFDENQRRTSMLGFLLSVQTQAACKSGHRVRWKHRLFVYSRESIQKMMKQRRRKSAASQQGCEILFSPYHRAAGFPSENTGLDFRTEEAWNTHSRLTSSNTCIIEYLSSVAVKTFKTSCTWMSSIELSRLIFIVPNSVWH